MQSQKPDIFLGLKLGFIVGILDIIPMFLQRLSIDAILSAFSMWLGVGFLLSVVNLNLNAITKGILISFVLLIPTAIIIGWNQPLSLFPIFIMTLILGSTIGYFFDKFSRN